MRLRNKPWAEEMITDHPEVIIPNPEDFKGNWQAVFGNDNPIHIEVGSEKDNCDRYGFAKSNNQLYWH